MRRRADQFAEVRRQFGETWKKFDEVAKEFVAVRKEMGEKIDRLSDRLERAEARTASRFRWTLGLILLSWLSLVGMVLRLHFRP